MFHEIAKEDVVYTRQLTLLNLLRSKKKDIYYYNFKYNILDLKLNGAQYEFTVNSFDSSIQICVVEEDNFFKHPLNCKKKSKKGILEVNPHNYR